MPVSRRDPRRRGKYQTAKHNHGGDGSGRRKREERRPVGRLSLATPEQRAYINGMGNHARNLWARTGYSLARITGWIKIRDDRRWAMEGW